MTEKATSIQKSQSQIEKFKAIAKEVEADGNEDAFNNALKKIGTAKIQTKENKKTT